MTELATPQVGESSPDDLALQRYLLDLALQPIDDFAGFAQLENFAGTALRYQLNVLSWALAIAQYTRTPAFTGYLTEAHGNTIAKMRDRCTWGYWRTENLLGNQSPDPNPIVKDNVMYTGFFGVMLGLFETLNDDRFSQPGALTLRWSDETSFPYEFARLCATLERNMRESRSTPMYPCEPHLVYPLCNLCALNALAMHDRLHATTHTGDMVARMRERWDEDAWRSKDGRWVPGRTDRAAIKIAPATLAYDACMAYWLNALMPDLAQDTWQAILARAVHADGGGITFRGRIWDKLDVGNYNLARGLGFTLATAMNAAVELGAADTAARLAQSLATTYETVEQHGACKLDQASLLTNATHLMARFGRVGAMRDLVNGAVPAAWRRGPILAQAAYPDVLVARAVTDGEALELILRAGGDAGRTTLAIQRLAPGREYSIDGAVDGAVTAGDDGAALIEVDLQARLEVRVRPAP